MAQNARLIFSGEMQAVCLPDEFRFAGSEVLIRRDHETGDVILTPRPFDWNAFFLMREKAEVPADFMRDSDREQCGYRPDPFDWYVENEDLSS